MNEPMSKAQQFYLACLQRDLGWTAERIAELARAQRIEEPSSRQGAQRLITLMQAIRRGDYVREVR